MPDSPITVQAQKPVLAPELEDALIDLLADALVAELMQTRNSADQKE